MIGGNSVINGGIMGVPGTPMQKKDGLEDSPKELATCLRTHFKKSEDAIPMLRRI